MRRFGDPNGTQPRIARGRGGSRVALRLLAVLAVAVAAGILLRSSRAGEPPAGPRPGSSDSGSPVSGGAEPLRSPHGPMKLDCSVCHSPEVWKPARIRGEFDHAAFGFPLTNAHSALACRGCHVSLEFARADGACASCHEDVHRGELGADCGSCHNTQTFLDRPEMVRAHQATAFPLSGAHLVTDCRDCHRQAAVGETQFLAVPTDCASCHEGDFARAADPDHVEAGFPQDCALCHSVSGWSSATFDHAATAFPLEGGHRAALCSECHADGVYDGRRGDCVACHQSAFDGTTDPGHAAAGFSQDCAACHSTASWEGGAYDHGTTSFALTGAHAVVSCDECHATAVYDGARADCVACHESARDEAKDPGHHGFPDACADCHSTASWAEASFNHVATEFPLTGVHALASCADCHADGVSARSSRGCVACHEAARSAARNPDHSGFSNDCAECHTTDSWKNAAFQHDATGFPLTGAHSAASCLDCHSGGVNNGLDSDCVACHQSDYDGTTQPDHAAAGFLTDCTACHSTTTWDDASFDHNATGFPLTGAHVSASCVDCHSGGAYDGLDTDCVGCHQDDYDRTTEPNHAAAGFPTDCTACHTTTTWDGASFNHNATAFPLTGAHLGATCLDCHSGGVYNGLDTDCVACHQADYDGTTEPNHAAAGFPTDCTACHSTTTWDGASFDHNATGFPLTGAHLGATCLDCHSGGVYNGLDTDCVGCHQDDYDGTTEPNHAAAGFPTDCTACHNTTTWDGASFDHNETGFPLTGAHSAASCLGCHASGVYDGLQSECVACHQSDYDGTTEPNHAAAGFPTNCTACHNTTTWAGASFDHNATGFPLTGAHSAASCLGCHASGVYDGLQSECVACHQSDYDGTTEPNHAAAGFPTDCTACHSTTTWDGASFDHNATGFPLTGAHLGATCLDCHSGGVYNGLDADCVACHQSDYDGTTEPNHAAAGFPTDCTACHTTTTWDGASFNHNATGFPLTGAHVSASCVDCHSGGVYDGLGPDCVACHQADYDGTTEPNHAAAGFPTDCTACHTTTTWDGASFNHNATGFPLTGAHVSASCLDCHSGGVYNGLDTDCVGCHQNDYDGTTQPDHAAAGFPTDCAACHTTTTWDGASFNHNATGFPLTGAHVAASCLDCHSSGIYNGLDTDCVACHQDDYDGTTQPDHAAAGFPTDCAACHTTTTWDGASFNHNATGFPLTGAHLTATCLDCHSSGIYNGLDTDCVACHQDDYDGTTQPDHAAAGFPTDCTACHTTVTWQGATFDHDDQWFPIYSGKHREKWDSCFDCHVGPPDCSDFSCIQCHEHDNPQELDDKHRNIPGYSYGPHTCYECHPNGDD